MTFRRLGSGTYLPLLLVLAIACFAGAISVRIVDPVVPDIARDLGASVATVALLASAFSFPYAFGQPILGPLGDALGKARVVKAGLAVLTVMLILSALAPTIELLFAARILAGLAAGGIIPVALAMVGDRFAMDVRQVALSRILLAATIGQILSMVGTGFVAAWAGWRWAIGIAAAASLAALAVALVSLKPRPGAVRQPLTPARLRANYRVVFANPRAKFCYGGVFIGGLVIFGFSPFVATLLEARGAGGIREAGLVLAGLGIGGVVYGLLVRTLLRRLGGMFNVMRIGSIVAASGLAALALQPSWPAQVAAFVVLGLGFFMYHNSLQTQATELAPSARGSAVALHAFFFFSGQAAGPILYQVGFALLGPTPTLLIAAGLLAGLGCWIVAMLRRQARPPSSG